VERVLGTCQLIMRLYCVLKTTTTTIVEDAAIITGSAFVVAAVKKSTTAAVVAMMLPARWEKVLIFGIKIKVAV